MQPNNETIIEPRELAKKFEIEIKDYVAKKFAINQSELSLLLEDEQGAYFSKQEPNSLCIFVVGVKNGYLYLVTAELEGGGQGLLKFKSEIVS